MEKHPTTKLLMYSFRCAVSSLSVKSLEKSLGEAAGCFSFSGLVCTRALTLTVEELAEGRIDMAARENERMNCKEKSCWGMWSHVHGFMYSFGSRIGHCTQRRTVGKEKNRQHPPTRTCVTVFATRPSDCQGRFGQMTHTFLHVF